MYARLAVGYEALAAMHHALAGGMLDPGETGAREAELALADALRAIARTYRDRLAVEGGNEQ
jgi:hypothetical protein